jgi:hypothetical protein
LKKKLRWKLLIYPSFQLRLLAMNLAFAAGMCGIIAVLSARSFSRLRELGTAASLAPTHPYFQLLELQIREFWVNLAIAFGVSFALFSLGALYLSNRLAGPIVRMRGFFRGLGSSSSEPDQLKFRKDDFFGDLPPLINSALSRLRK